MKDKGHRSSRLPLNLKISAGMPSEPYALLFCKLFAAADISSIVSSYDMMGSCGN